MKIKFLGQPLTLLGTQVKVGDKASDATLVKKDLTPTTLFSFEGNKVISVVPSIDTGVCDAQTREFNSRVKNATVITVSNDLPFAQARWCGANGFDHVITLSDYLMHDFGMKYGTLIEELKIQTRAVFVLNAANEVVYVEYLDEITEHPNYDAALEVLETL